MRKARIGASLLAMIAPLTSVVATETTAYRYDALGRLVSVESSGSVSSGQAVTTTFDAAGNRSNYTVTGASPAPALSIGSASVTEGGDLVFTVSLASAAPGLVTVSYASSSGTATSPGDFTHASGTLTFIPGETTKTITITTVDDAIAESTEAMAVTISGAVGSSVITDTASGTILDDDIVHVSIGDAGGTEGGNLAFVVTRSQTTSSSASVNYTTIAGTAGAGSDFNSSSGTINFAPGETSKVISIGAVDDSIIEPVEAMYVNLSSPSGNVIITRYSASGTINDNDAPIVITNDGLQVLPEHVGTYNCYRGPFTVDWGWGMVITYWVESCMRNSDEAVVYDRSNDSPATFANGYIMPNPFQLEVHPPYYGTATY